MARHAGTRLSLRAPHGAQELRIYCHRRSYTGARHRRKHHCASWISATLLNPIPGVVHTSDLVTVMRGDRSDHPTPPFSYPDLHDLSERTQTFSGLLGYHDDYMSLTGAAKPERIYGALTTANYFDVLGVHAILGRTFLPEEGTPRAGAAVIVIGYTVWQNHFAGDSHIVGKTIQINRHPYTVIGVAPRDFTGCAPGLRTDLWIPLPMDRDVWGGGPSRLSRHFLAERAGKASPGCHEESGRGRAQPADAGNRRAVPGGSPGQPERDFSRPAVALSLWHQWLPLQGSSDVAGARRGST